MADPSGSGSFPRIPQELAAQVQQQIESLMEHAITAASQALVAVEDVVASGSHSGAAAVVSQQKAIEINADLTKIINGCNELAHQLGVNVRKFAHHDADATSLLQSITP
jgi:hypothetical protein